MKSRRAGARRGPGWAAALVVLLLLAAGAGAEAPPGDRVPLSELALEGAPSLGPPGAAVTVVEFADFSCLYCARSSTTLHRLLELYPSQVRWVFKHFPLRVRRPERDVAHLASLAAEGQGKFWPMHDLLFRAKPPVGRDEVMRMAAELNLDEAQFVQALDNRDLRAAILRDVELARRLHVTVTPTAFVNGRRVVGARPLRDLRRIVEDELREGTTTSGEKPETGRN